MRGQKIEENCLIPYHVKDYQFQPFLLHYLSILNLFWLKRFRWHGDVMCAGLF